MQKLFLDDGDINDITDMLINIHRYGNVSYDIETQVTYHILMQLNTYLKTLYSFFL